MTDRFLEFVHKNTGETGQRCDVTGQSEHNVSRCLRGMLINMHQDWFVRDTANIGHGEEQRS